MRVTVDGAAAFAATGGRDFDPALPTLVFVHGAGMDHTVWQLQSRYFAHHGRSVLAVDLPGHGRSEGAPRDSIAGYADWLLAFIEAAGAARAALVGHSMGALTVLEAAARAGARATRLALLGVAERMPVHPDLLAAAGRGEHLAFDLVTSWGFGERGHLGGHRAPGVWMMGGGLRLLEQSRSSVLANDLVACNAYGGALAAAGKVSCPTLFLLAADDRMTPAKGARALIEATADGRAEILDDCGHMSMIERSDRVLDSLRRFLES